MMGGVQFRAMQAELEQSGPSTPLGAGKMTNRDFNDSILKAGSMPVELARASVTKQTLPKDYKTSWKFIAALK